MLWTKKVKAALNIAYAAHIDQKDKAGVPYIFHPYRVAERALSILPAADPRAESATVVSLLHDVLEDTSSTIESLRANMEKEGCPLTPAEEQALDSVTRRPMETYSDFILRAKADPIGVVVKYADVCDNLDETRLEIPHAPSLFHRYQSALEVLSSCL